MSFWRMVVTLLYGQEVSPVWSVIIVWECQLKKTNIEKTVDIVSAAIIRNGDVYHIAQEERKKAREEYMRERRERKEREQSLLEEVKSL